MVNRIATREDDERLLHALALRDKGESVAVAAAAAGLTPRALRLAMARIARAASGLSDMRGLPDQTE